MSQLATSQVKTVKTARRLIAAEGYLDLGMPQRAFEELHAIEDPGIFEAELNYLIGQAFKAQERYEAAIHPLQRAAMLFADPFNRVALLSLSECYRKCHRDDLADAVEKAARAPADEKGGKVQVVVILPDWIAEAIHR